MSKEDDITRVVAEALGSPESVLVRTTVYLPKGVKDELRELSRASKKPLDNVVLALLKRGLKDVKPVKGKF